MSRSGEAESFVELAQQVAKALGRDETRKRRVAVNLAQAGFAMDAAQISEMSSRELASHALDQLGLKVGRDGDPLIALDFYLAGLNARGGGCAVDASESAPAFLERYLNETQS